ncbi:hypothetical protein BGZ75_007583 [Mortierella antarctica]|nr:hypothetical protein BGZ75_007583 [Mortierella antarctica]
MKSIFYTAILATVGSLGILGSRNSVAEASQITGLEKRQQDYSSSSWCSVFVQGCSDASLVVCGTPNFDEYRCNVSIMNGKCSSYGATCICKTASSVSTDATNSALENTFAATNGFCRSAAGSYKPPTSTSVSPSTTASSNPVAPMSSSSNPAATTTVNGTRNSASLQMAAFSAVALPIFISLGLLSV